MNILQLAHREYLRSSTWKDKRLQVLERDNHKCQRCGQYGYQVHHKTYKNWGNEKLNELETLCGSCHEIHHSSHKGSKTKSIGNRAMYNYMSRKHKNLAIKEFNFKNDMDLYTNIYISPNEKLCYFVSQMLGFDYWYNQNINLNKPIGVGDNRDKHRKNKDLTDS